ncbi:nucleotidyltransferase domain-containing protein [Bacillus sp. NP157]|nr:nucleotidyltransferase domain-containing protein [Bacillus sp. NP157]
MTSVLDALFDGQRQKALAYLYLRDGAPSHVREIARATGTHAGSLHRELARLAEAGLLTRDAQGNQVLYRANPACSVYSELTAIFQKTVGIPAMLRDHLAPLAPLITAAFVFGSTAKGSATPQSDIDVMVIGDVSFRSLVAALHACQTMLTREVNPSLYSHAEFQAKVTAGDTFLCEVIAQPKLFVLGSEHDLGQFGVDRTAPADSA